MDKIQFDFMPEELAKFSIDDHDDVDKLYKLCYRLVYKGEDPDSFYRIKNAEQKLYAQAEAAKCSLKLYIMCVMLARRQLAPDQRFLSRYLFGVGAAKLVQDYRQMARDRYGSFDYESLASLTDGDELTRAKKRILNSEIFAGKWIVGYKIKHGGSPINDFYRFMEIKLDPAWLCLESSYYPFHDKHQPISGAVADHRVKVNQLNGWLRRRRDVATAYFSARSEMFPSAVAAVVNHFGFRPDDFEGPSIVTDATKFWSRLAFAIQHVRCLEDAGVL